MSSDWQGRQRLEITDGVVQCPWWKTKVNVREQCFSVCEYCMGSYQGDGVHCKFSSKSKLSEVVSLGGPGSGHYGHAGIPGHHGGSLPGGSGSQSRGGFSSASGIGSVGNEHLYRVDSYIDTHDMEDPEFNWENMYNGGEHDEGLTSLMGGTRSDEFPDTYRLFSSDKVLAVKQKAAETLAEETGLDIEGIRNHQTFWIDPSSPGAVAFQATLQEVFQLGSSSHLEKLYQNYERQGKILDGELIDSSHKGTGILSNISYGKGMRSLDYNGRKQLAKTVYDNTQAALKKELGDRTHVRLYRGTKNQDVVGSDVGSRVGINTNPVSSWSPSPSVARMFAAGGGAVVAADFPVDRIFSIPQTGFGDLTMGEVLVLSAPNDIVEVYDVL